MECCSKRWTDCVVQSAVIIGDSRRRSWKKRPVQLTCGVNRSGRDNIAERSFVLAASQFGTSHHQDEITAKSLSPQVAYCPIKDLQLYLRF